MRNPVVSHKSQVWEKQSVKWKISLNAICEWYMPFSVYRYVGATFFSQDNFGISCEIILNMWKHRDMARVFWNVAIFTFQWITLLRVFPLCEMVKDQDIIQAVKDRNVPVLQKLLVKTIKSNKSKYYVDSHLVALPGVIYRCAYVGSRVQSV